MQGIRPDLAKSKTNWTTRFGEYICRELFLLQGHNVTKPQRIAGFEPDWQTDSIILEAKTQTYFTTGTAAEKILGTPFKYADVPQLYGKGLRIVCMGGAEQHCRHFGVLPGPRMTATKQKILDFWKQNNIEYVAATDILTSLVH